jgi:acetyl esterase/lipase
MGEAVQDDGLVSQMAAWAGCMAVSVQYRLAPEDPYPRSLQDADAALSWVLANASALGVDPDRIAVGGASAGGGLAAGLALLARDRGQVGICFQLLVYPMLDDRRAGSGSSREDLRVWSTRDNRFAWDAYLRRLSEREDVPVYAAPSRSQDLSGLPPTGLLVGDLDIFFKENIDYTRRLQAAEIPVDLRVYGGAFHGFNVLAPQAELSKRFNRDLCEILAAGMTRKFAPASAQRITRKRLERCWR